MPEELFISADKYPVYRGDFVVDYLGTTYEALFKNKVVSTDGVLVEVTPDKTFELSPFSIIKRMMTYGLLNASLLINAEDALPDPLIDYLEYVLSVANSEVQTMLNTKHSIGYHRRRVGECEYMFVLDSDTDESLSGIPIWDWFQMFVTAFTDSMVTPLTVARRLADEFYALLLKYKGNAKEIDSVE